MIIAFVIAIAIVVIDQVSKLIASSLLIYNQSVSIIPYLINFRLVYNTGAAWSILSDHHWILALISVIATIGLIYFVIKKVNFKEHKILSIALSMLLGGCIGNMIDRLFFEKGVIDFIELAFMNFPVFNVADLCLTTGVIMLMVHLLFLDKDAVFKKNDQAKVEESPHEE